MLTLVFAFILPHDVSLLSHFNIRVCLILLIELHLQLLVRGVDRSSRRSSEAMVAIHEVHEAEAKRINLAIGRNAILLSTKVFCTHNRLKMLVVEHMTIVPYWLSAPWLVDCQVCCLNKGGYFRLI